MDIILKEAEEKMKKTISILANDYSKINAGRANPVLLDKILVNYYQTPTKITQLASINVISGSTILIKPFDLSILSEIEKAILSSDLGINPQNDGKMLKLNFPSPTEEKRKNIVKEISKTAENSKISIRNVRRDIIDKFKKMLKNSEITQDILNKSSNKIQNLTDKYVKEINIVLEKKTKRSYENIVVDKFLEIENLPKHIAIIMDGNGRWAKKKFMPRFHGHKIGADNFKSIVKYCNKIGISHLTFFAFSTENWKRPKNEIEFLMKLFKIYLKEALEKFKEENIKIIFLGDKKCLSKSLAELMIKVEKASFNHTGMTLNIALNYGSKKEIVMATKIIAKKIKNNKLNIECINENLISDHLYTKNQPDVDLLIRTGAEKRISNFLLWQSAYAEFIFTKKFWPDFDCNELNKALKEFSLRNRRFGRVIYN